MTQRFVFCLPAIFLLAACTGPAPAPQPREIAMPESAAEIVSPPEEVVAGRQPSDLDLAINELLQAGDSALVMDYLTTPADDNALDRYRAVLLLRPNEPRALAGIERIFERYVAMTHAAIADADVARARELLSRARQVKADASTLRALENAIAEINRRQPPAEIVATDNDDEIVLDARALDRKDPEIIEHLRQLAQRVSESAESLLIIARNDAEGRWIYKQLNDAVPHYRVRGDIRLGQRPKIVLQPPIE